MVYGGILAGFGGIAIALSLAEMASMCVFFHTNCFRADIFTYLSLVIPSSEHNIAGQPICPCCSPILLSVFSSL